MIFDFSCDIGHIQNDIPHQLWEAISADGNAPPLITRFLHNTPSFYLVNLLRCYLFYLSPEFLNQVFSLVGMGLFYFGLWHIVTGRKWLILAILLAAPLSPLFDVPQSGQMQTIVFYGTLVLVMIFGVVNLVSQFRRR